MSPQKREAAQRAMQKMGGQEEPKPQRDQRAWAREILRDPRGRSQEVVRMAQRAVEEQA